MVVGDRVHAFGTTICSMTSALVSIVGIAARSSMASGVGSNELLGSVDFHQFTNAIGSRFIMPLQVQAVRAEPLPYLKLSSADGRAPRKLRDVVRRTNQKLQTALFLGHPGVKGNSPRFALVRVACCMGALRKRGALLDSSPAGLPNPSPAAFERLGSRLRRARRLVLTAVHRPSFCI